MPTIKSGDRAFCPPLPPILSGTQETEPRAHNLEPTSLSPSCPQFYQDPSRQSP